MSRCILCMFKALYIQLMVLNKPILFFTRVIVARQVEAVGEIGFFSSLHAGTQNILAF